jgi:ParB family chromosome partitioning protein
LTLDAPDAQVAIARQIVEKGLSVREVERRVQKASRPIQHTHAVRVDANTREAESHLEQALGTRVRVRRRGRKGSRGRLEIEFHSEDELHRIYETVLRGARTAKPRTLES